MLSQCKALLFGVLMAGAVTTAPAFAADGDRIEVTQGEVQALDFGTSTSVISGVSYAVAPDARIEIAGTYGAFTMLTVGMDVEFSFRRFDDGRRVIIELEQLPGNVEPELF